MPTANFTLCASNCSINPKALGDEIREKHGQVKADLDREAEQIRGAMTGRESLAEMLSEVALRLKNEFRVPGA